MDRMFRIQKVLSLVHHRVIRTPTPCPTPAWCQPQMKVLTPLSPIQTDSPLGGKLPSSLPCQDHTPSPSHPSHSLLVISHILIDSLGQRTSFHQDSEDTSRTYSEYSSILRRCTENSNILRTYSGGCTTRQIKIAMLVCLILSL